MQQKKHNNNYQTTFPFSVIPPAPTGVVITGVQVPTSRGRLSTLIGSVVLFRILKNTAEWTQHSTMSDACIRS